MITKKTTLALLILIPQIGLSNSYIKSHEIESYVTDDVAIEISKNYPAANTVIVLNPKDNLTVQLSQSLREKGFAVSNNQENSAKKSTKPRIILDENLKDNLKQKGYVFSSDANTDNVNSQPETKHLSIILDKIETDLFRVQFIINSNIFSRAYVRESESQKILPAGSWTIKRK